MDVLLLLRIWDRWREVEHTRATVAALPAVVMLNVYRKRGAPPVKPEHLVGRFRSLFAPAGDLERKFAAIVGVPPPKRGQGGES